MKHLAVAGLLALLTAPILASDDEITVESFPVEDGQSFTVLNGDTNGDLERDLSDVVHLLNFLYLGGPAPSDILQCEGEDALKNGDSNADGAVDVSDGLHMLSWMYAGGPEPAVPCDTGVVAGATVIHSTTQVTGSPPPRFNPCNGDIVALNGEITSVQHTTINPNGGSMTHLNIHWHHLTGTGLITGQTYGVNGGVNFVIQNLAPGSTISTVANERLITQGAEANFLTQFHFQTTMNANGEITVNFGNISFECRGN